MTDPVFESQRVYSAEMAATEAIRTVLGNSDEADNFVRAVHNVAREEIRAIWAEWDKSDK